MGNTIKGEFMQKKSFFQFIGKRIKGDIANTVVFAIYVTFCLASCVYFAIDGRGFNALTSALFTLVVPAVWLFEYLSGVRFVAVFSVFFLYMCLGNITGNGYHLYARVPYYDKILHTLSGVVFTCFGYALTQLALNGDDGKKWIACFFFAFAVTMATAAIWEIFEFTMSPLMHHDMQSNTITKTTNFNNIVEKTIVFFADGTQKTYQGYLDIGLYDTILDTVVCLIGSVVTLLVLGIERAFKKKNVKKLIIPFMQTENKNEAV